MDDKTTLTAVKLTSGERAALAQLVADGHYATLSRALRAAVMLLLDLHSVSLETLADIRVQRLHHRMRRRKRAGDGDDGQADE